jgi:pimeloyl-ACP methyl ester carboxylesterase
MVGIGISREVLLSSDQYLLQGLACSNLSTPLKASLAFILTPFGTVMVLEAIRALFSLKWRNSPQEVPLPPNFERIYVQTRLGKVELLYAKPSAQVEGPRKQPVFFVHGGFGCAAVWIDWMVYLASQGYPCYAVSMRGHGASWSPSFLRMVWFTGRDALAGDVIAGLDEAMSREDGRQVVLVGHSAGGGMSQYILGYKDVKVNGFVLVAAIPFFGG